MNLDRRIATATAIAIPMLVLSFTEYYWQQISEFAAPLGMTALLALVIIALYKLLSTSLTVFKNGRNLNLKLVAPTSIYLVTLVLLWTNPSFLNADSYQAQIEYRGCYEGTMNTAVIYFRESGGFEYKHVGFFGITSFTKGNWTQRGDTLIINYSDTPSEFVGSRLLLTDYRFIKIEGDSLQTGRFGFYRGYCKGLN
jgi:hypothetical protein